MRALLAPLFEPLTIRRVELRNRLVMAPMTRGFSPHGIPDRAVAGYYRRRAQGETGLIITEGVGVDHPAALGNAGLDERYLPHMYGEAALEGWRRVVEEVHAAGGVIFPQLWHQGPMRIDGTGPNPEAPSCRPSGIWGPASGVTSIAPQFVSASSAPTLPMTEEDIADVISAFGRSAAHAKALGFDGIAIHGAHGYLIDTFLWAETNRRTDQWGGDCRRRSQFAVEVVKAIRLAVGEELPIVFRFSQFKQQDFRARLAATPNELEEVMGPIADAGVDVFDASVRYFNSPAFADSPLNLSGWVRKVTGKLSMTVGGVGMDKGYGGALDMRPVGATDNLIPLMERFGRKEFDLVGVGRALLNDPCWPRKIRRGEVVAPFSSDSLKVLC